jgi:subtilisin/minor extracellular protease Epr
VAGTIVAQDDGPNSGGGNVMGISVVGVGPQIALYAAKVLGREGTGSTSDAVAALDVAARYGMRVVNMSFGSPFSSKTFQSACARAYSAGVLLVAAAGNEAAPWLDVPARYASVISVGATNALDQHPTFSNTSKNLELCAPGVAVLSTMPTYPVRLNQWPYGYRRYYDYLDGTSMAAPHVTGTAALVIAAHPEWSDSQVRARLVSAAIDLGAAGRDSLFGYGLVSASAAQQ